MLYSALSSTFHGTVNEEIFAWGVIFVLLSSLPKLPPHENKTYMPL